MGIQCKCYTKKHKKLLPLCVFGPRKPMETFMNSLRDFTKKSTTINLFYPIKKNSPYACRDVNRELYSGGGVG